MSKTPDPDRILAGKIARAKLVLFFEAVWTALFPALAILGALALAILTGVLDLLPTALRLGVLALFLVALGWSLRPLLQIRWPGEDDALRRLETRSGLAHRPATSYRDTLPDDEQAPATSQALWAAHKARLVRLLGGLKAGWPRSALAERDPYALRYALALGLIAVLALTSGEWTSRVEQAVRLDAPAAARTVSLDAWITPPAYTGKPPIFLAGPSATEDASAPREEIIVPEGSELVIRLNGASEPTVRFSGTGQQAETVVLDEQKVPRAARESVHELRETLKRPAYVTVSDNGDRLGSWELAILPDSPPKAEIRGDPAITASRALRFDYRAHDDYGVTGLEATFDLSDNQNGEEGVDSAGLFMFDPPDFEITLPRANTREANSSAFRDLTAHPWAGFAVDMRLKATDAAGQTGTSEPVTFTLPEREFREPLARALVEQRRKLILDADQQPVVARALEALTIYPDGTIERSGVYLGIRTVYLNLLRAENREDIASVIDLLWEIALSVEDGNLSLAERELRAVQKELEKALAENAPAERIEELMAKLRQALDRYLKAMVEQAIRNAQRDGMNPDEMAEAVRPQDLGQMLDTLENLARSGARDAAQELLSQLDNILRNLRPNLMSRMSPQRNTPMARALDELGQMMNRQQGLMDETFRMPEEGDSQRGQSRNGRNDPSQSLSGQQGALGEMLRDFLSQLQRQGLDAPSSLGQAEEAMRGATEALRGRQKGEALGQQGEALDKMRQGAQAMAEQMMQQGEGSTGNFGRHGEGSRGDNLDPLGRPRRWQGEQYGENRDVVPNEMEIQRAREILRSLRQKLNDPLRPGFERDYFERLLRNIY